MPDTASAKRGAIKGVDLVLKDEDSMDVVDEKATLNLFDGDSEDGINPPVASEISDLEFALAGGTKRLEYRLLALQERFLLSEFSSIKSEQSRYTHNPPPQNRSAGGDSKVSRKGSKPTESTTYSLKLAVSGMEELLRVLIASPTICSLTDAVVPLSLDASPGGTIKNVT
jgi:hypothetical protein